MENVNQETISEETVQAIEASEEILNVGSEESNETDSNEGNTEKPQIERVDESDCVACIEALLFASGEPVSSDQLAKLIGHPKKETLLFIEDLQRKLEGDHSGFEIQEVGGKFQLRTKVKFGEYVRALRAEKPKKLTASALETLAIVAYRQPITKSDIDSLRGVDSTPTIKTLIERGMIEIIGHQPTAGSPAIYGTSAEFLKIFGLKSLSALPSIKDIRMFEAEPGEI